MPAVTRSYRLTTFGLANPSQDHKNDGELGIAASLTRTVAGWRACASIYTFASANVFVTSHT
jgi:hypothetical protein